jgi:uncharacterized membrane protein YagU involved in acid resistance
VDNVFNFKENSMKFLQNGREYGILGAGGLIGSALTVLIPWGWKKIMAPKKEVSAEEAPKKVKGA